MLDTRPIMLTSVAVIVPRFDYRIEFSVAQDVGRWRESNEDAVLAAPELALFAVADGMGGHNAGEVAARLALDEVKTAIAGERSQKVIDAYVNRPNLETRRNVFRRLKRVVERANERVRAAAVENETWRGMGTTLDVVWLARHFAFIAHAGDGRVYLARARTVLQLTQDHGQVESLKATGVLRPQTKKYADALLNAVGLRESISVDTLFVDLGRKDRLLLCTDGVHSQVGSEGALSALMREPSTERAASALVSRAAEGGKDNATALVLEVGDLFVKRESEDRGLAAADFDRACQSPLLAELPVPVALGALAAAVEIELEPGTPVPRVLANDLVAYIVLDGVVTLPDRRRVSTGAILFPESLAGVWGAGQIPIVEHTARLLRVRADDFEEVCHDPRLGSELYRRLAQHLARLSTASGPAAPPITPESEAQEAATSSNE